MRKFFTRTNRLSNTTKTKTVAGKSEIEDNAYQGRTGPVLETKGKVRIILKEQSCALQLGA